MPFASGAKRHLFKDDEDDLRPSRPDDWRLRNDIISASISLLRETCLTSSASAFATAARIDSAVSSCDWSFTNLEQRRRPHSFSCAILRL